MASLWKFIKSKVTHQDRSNINDILLLTKGTQHGFPECPTAFDYDNKLNLLAVGTALGIVKVLGAPGVELVFVNEKNRPVSKLLFVPNEGRLVVIYEDGIVELLEINLKDGTSILESVKSIPENEAGKVSAASVVRCSENWVLLVGTKDGDVLSISLPSLSPVENLNLKTAVVESTTDAISSEQKSALGCVVAFAQNPLDHNRNWILIGFSSGSVALYNINAKGIVQLYYLEQGLTSVTWQANGVFFVTSYDDGSYAIWNYTQSEVIDKPVIPYGPFPCTAIRKIIIKTAGISSGLPMIIFAGGLPRERYTDHHTITVQQGEKHTALDFPTEIIDFIAIGDENSVLESDDVHTLVVLLKDQLLAIDVTSDKYPEIVAPYLINLHAPITTFEFYPNVSAELVQQLQDVGNKPSDKRPFGGYIPKYSQRAWPITGGQSLVEQSAKNDLVVTAHGDGCVRFWLASALGLRLLHKVDVFSRYYFIEGVGDYPEDSSEGVWPPFRKYGIRGETVVDPRLQIDHFAFELTSRTLVVAGTAGQVMVYQFNEEYAIVDFQTLKVKLVGEEYEYVWRGTQALEPRSGNLEIFAGFQGQLSVQLDPPAQITALEVRPEWNLIAIGTGHGFVLVDYLQKNKVLTFCTLTLANGIENHESVQQRLKGAGDTIRRSLRRIPRPALHMTFPRSTTSYSVQDNAANGSSLKKSTLATSITTDGIVDHTTTVSPIALPVLIEDGQEENAGGSGKPQVEESSAKPEDLPVVHDKVVLQRGEGALLAVANGNAVEKASIVSELAEGQVESGERKESVNEVVIFESEVPPPGPTTADEKHTEKGDKTEEPTKIGAANSIVEPQTETKVERVYNYEATTVRTLLLTDSHIVSESTACPSLWVGLNNGRIIIYTLNLPTPETQKFEQVTASLSKEIHLRHGAPVIFLAVLECPAAGKRKSALGVINPGASPLPASPVPSIETAAPTTEPVVTAVVGTEEPRSPTPSATKLAGHTSGLQKVVVVSEEQIKIFDLPSLKAFGKRKLHVGKFKRATILEFALAGENEVLETEKCIATLSSRGEVELFSLPHLKRHSRQMLLEKDNLAMVLGKNGCGIFQSGSNELQRFAVTKDAIQPLQCTIALPEGARPVPVIAEVVASESEQIQTKAPIDTQNSAVSEKLEETVKTSEQTEAVGTGPVETIVLHDTPVVEEAAPTSITSVDVTEQIMVMENETTHAVSEVRVVKTTTTTTIEQVQETTEDGAQAGDNIHVTKVILQETTFLESGLNESVLSDADTSAANLTSDNIVDHTNQTEYTNGDKDESGEAECGMVVHNMEEKLRNLEIEEQSEIHHSQEAATH